MMPSSLTWNKDSKTATNIELATLVNSPIDVTFLVDIPTTDRRLFVFERTAEGSLSTGPWNRWIIVSKMIATDYIFGKCTNSPYSLKVYASVTYCTEVQSSTITTDTATYSTLRRSWRITVPPSERTFSVSMWIIFIFWGSLWKLVISYERVDVHTFRLHGH